MHRTFVVPAEAGIQEPVGSKSDILYRSPDYWMPASAGMTFICDGLIENRNDRDKPLPFSLRVFVVKI
jgi:hypothetical protein